MRQVQLQIQIQRALSLTLLFSTILGSLSIATAETSVALWQGDKEAAVSITFDDGLSSQFGNAFPLLQQRGLKGTFFIISSDIDFDDIEPLISNGQEIGSHSVSHPNLTRLKKNQNLEDQLGDSQLYLKDLTGQDVLTFAYPYGEYNQDVINITDDYYIAGRTAFPYALNSSSPAFYELYVIGPNGPDGNVDPIVYLNNSVDLAIVENKWAIEMFHEIDNPSGWDNVSSEAFSAHLDYLVANEHNVWVAPMGTVSEYIYERDAALINTLESTSNLIRLNLSCGLDSRFNTPLTLLTECPVGWESSQVHVQQGQMEQMAEIVFKNGSYYMMYNALPDVETIELSRTQTTCTLIISAGPNGSIDPPGTVIVDYGSNQMFTATPDVGYEVDSWSVNGNEVQVGGTTYTLTNITADHTVSVTFKSLIYTISGYCIEPDGVTPLEGVLIQTSTDANTVTDANGFYALWVDYGWSGNVTPQKNGYFFDPNNDEYVAVTQDYINANYIAERFTFKITGVIFEPDFMTPISDVNVTAENGGGVWTSKYGSGPSITDVNGFYELVVDYNWSGMAVPTKYAYAFEPGHLDYANVLTDWNGQDYIGELMTYVVSGHVRNDCGIPIPGVQVSADNGGGSALTDPNGFYEVWVSYNWSGTLTPGDKAHYTFVPPQMIYAGVLGDQLDQDYVAENVYDLDCNGSMTLGDLQILCNNWLATGSDVPGDFHRDEDNIVNLLDFSEFAHIWLTE